MASAIYHPSIHPPIFRSFVDISLVDIFRRWRLIIITIIIDIILLSSGLPCVLFLPWALVSFIFSLFLVAFCVFAYLSLTYAFLFSVLLICLACFLSFFFFSRLCLLLLHLASRIVLSAIHARSHTSSKKTTVYLFNYLSLYVSGFTTTGDVLSFFLSF